MHCQRCGDCCTQTEMLLSNKDIERLQNQGYHKEQFARFNKAGYAVLKNQKGFCFFYNPMQRRCIVYTVRPSGCRVYPVILDEDKGIVADEICRAHATVTEEEKRRKGRLVVRLLDEIDAEAEKRCLTGCR